MADYAVSASPVAPVFGLPGRGRSPALARQSAKIGLVASGSTITLPAAPVKGNHVVLFSTCEGSATFGTAPGGSAFGASWTQIIQSSLSGMEVQAWLGVVGSSPATTATVSLGSTMTAIAVEFSNLIGIVTATRAVTGVDTIEPLGKSLASLGGIVVSAFGYRGGGANNAAWPAGWNQTQTVDYDARLAWLPAWLSNKPIWNSGGLGLSHRNMLIFGIR